MHGGVLANF